MQPLRIGTLGAANITPMALVRPARLVPQAQVVAVAARNPARAHKFAAKHQIPRVHESYEALLADPDVDAIYNPLPNSHHGIWTVRALEAGKHVLCEKPIAANAEEAAAMAAAAERTGKVLVEAFHWRYHALANRIREVLDSGELGELRHYEAEFFIPLVFPKDIRYRADLAGGALMDTGCYTVNIVRFLAQAEPTVVRARAKLSSPGVDRAMQADLEFPNGKTGRIACSLLSSPLIRARVYVQGDLGHLTAFNPIAPQFYNRLTVHSSAGKRAERVGGPASYTAQLTAFVDAVRNGASVPTSAEDGIANMAAIDAIYRAAGLKPRQPSS